LNVAAAKQQRQEEQPSVNAADPSTGGATLCSRSIRRNIRHVRCSSFAAWWSEQPSQKLRREQCEAASEHDPEI